MRKVSLIRYVNIAEEAEIEVPDAIFNSENDDEFWEYIYNLKNIGWTEISREVNCIDTN